MKKLFTAMAILSALVLTMLGGMFCVSGFDHDLFYDKDIISFVLIFASVMIGYFAVYIYQYNNNVLEYDSFGFATGGRTFSYRQVTKLVAIHRGRHGTYYHLYVGDEIIFKFSEMYENKDDFIEILQRNGVFILRL